jgi:hypothetical protein
MSTDRFREFELAAMMMPAVAVAPWETHQTALWRSRAVHRLACRASACPALPWIFSPVHTKRSTSILLGLGLVLRSHLICPVARSQRSSPRHDDALRPVLPVDSRGGEVSVIY